MVKLRRFLSRIKRRVINSAIKAYDNSYSCYVICPRCNEYNYFKLGRDTQLMIFNGDAAKTPYCRCGNPLLINFQTIKRLNWFRL